MKSRFFRALSLIVSLLLLIGAIPGCASNNQNRESSTSVATASIIPASESDRPVELQFYLIGNAPNDLQSVTDNINELALKDLNCTVKFNYTSWTDYAQKYNLLLQTGEPIDMIYTASWLDYSKLAKSGAFTPLDDLLPQYAADLYHFVPDDYWNQVKVDGRIYTIPGTWKEYVTDGFMYREDLREKYGLPIPNTLENVEAYLDGIKNNMPGQIITTEYPQFGPVTWSFGALEILSMKYKWVYFGTPYGLVADYDDPSNLRVYWGSPDFIEDMKMFKRWADKGFWSKSVLSSKTDMSAFNTGKTVAVIQGQNPTKYYTSITLTEAAIPGAKVGYIPYPEVNGVATSIHATQNGFAIPVSAQNPEKALMLYQKLVLDKTYNRLSMYGIEGKHYTVDNGYYVPVGDPSQTGFGREGMNGWSWRNPEFMLFPKGYDLVTDIFRDLDKIAQQTKFKGVNIYDGFCEDYSAYRSERSALGNVLTQYLIPLEAGLVPDVDEATAIFMEKAKEAGLDKIQAEYASQWKTYCEKNNYK